MTHPVVTRSQGTITVAPPAGTPHTALVILMHGLGDTANGFEDVATLWHGQLPHVKFVLPTAPTVPVTLNGGMPMPAWYDIVSLTEDRADQPVAGIQDSRRRIQGLLEDEHAQGMSFSRMALAGFSQGGAMSIFAGLQMPAGKELAGLVSMSGYLAGASDFTLSEGCKSTPVLHCHGTADPMVQFHLAEKTKAAITGMGHKAYTLRPFRGMVHTVAIEELNACCEFLRTHLPATTAEKAPEDMSIKELKAAIERGNLGKKAVGLREKQELVQLLKEGAAKEEL